MHTTHGKRPMKVRSELLTRVRKPWRHASVSNRDICTDAIPGDAHSNIGNVPVAVTVARDFTRTKI
jgi:hypothetical protein